MPSKSDSLPLPAGYKMAHSKEHNNKPYFIIEGTKETTWIDPRDKSWKPATWADCKGDETPFGWEVATDPVIGTYWIDHLNKRNVVDDPRLTKHAEQLQEVKQHIEKTKNVIASKQKTLRLKKDEMAKLRAEMAKEDKLAIFDEEVKSLEQDINSQNKAVGSMATVVKELEGDSADQLARQKQVQDEIAEVRYQLHEQTMMRSAIHTQLSKMQVSLETAQDDQTLQQIVKSANQVIDGKNPELADAKTTHAKAAQDGKGVFGMELHHVDTKQTRIEREMELLALKHQLEVERGETERLREIARRAKAEIEKALLMPANERRGKKPTWVKLLNENANKSGTIRFNVKQKAALAVEGGAVLSFREKMLYFTSAPLQK